MFNYGRFLQCINEFKINFFFILHQIKIKRNYKSLHAQFKYNRA